MFRNVIIISVFLLASALIADEHKYYFYHPENNIGSEASFNPIVVILNGGFDVLRNGKNSKNILTLKRFDTKQKSLFLPKNSIISLMQPRL